MSRARNTRCLKNPDGSYIAAGYVGDTLATLRDVPFAQCSGFTTAEARKLCEQFPERNWTIDYL